jgi:cholesterol transport system auxiliary component
VQFEQDFTVQPSRVRLTLRVQLVEVAARRLLASHTLRLEQPATSEDAPGGVAAANALLQQAVQEVADFCRRATSARPQ